MAMLTEGRARALAEARRKREAMARLGRDCDLRWLRADSLKRDADYQRAVRPERVEAIRARFHEDGLGTLTVSLRDDGDHWIIDGQHRCDAVLALGMGHFELPCIVHAGLTKAQERTIFLLLNKERLPLSHREAFAARAAQGENLAESLREALDAFGLRLVGGRANLGVRELGSAGPLERIDARHGEGMVERVLAVVEGGWPEQPGAYRACYLEAAAAVLADPAVEDARLAVALAGCLPPDLDRMVLEGMSRPGYRGHARYAAAMRRLHDRTAE